MNLEDDILIEKYLRKQLSKEESEMFLQKLNSDTGFKENFYLEKQLFHALNEETWSSLENKNTNEVNEYIDIIRSEEMQSLKSQLKKENVVYQNTIQKKSKNWYFYLTAAVIILLFTLINFIDFTKSSQDLYVNYLEKTELTSIITRGDNQDELSKAQVLFENKEFDKALIIFEKEINKENQSGATYIYIGVSQMELNQLDKAGNTFDRLIKSDLLDAQKGHWFKALLFLKKDNSSKAKLVLNKIITDKLYNYQKAQELLDDLS